MSARRRPQHLHLKAAGLARRNARFEKSFEGEIDLEAFAAEGRAAARRARFMHRIDTHYAQV